MMPYMGDRAEATDLSDSCPIISPQEISIAVYRIVTKTSGS
jgi:hypothetical protein